MSFLVDAPVLQGRDGPPSPAQLVRRFETYKQYLESIRLQLPHSALQFAIADWHYDSTDPRCPHDAWLESLLVSESAIKERPENRGVTIQIRLLGAYHDGHIELSYRDVRAYTLHSTIITQPIPTNGGHGDWLIDEIRLSERGNVLHEIVFSHESHWIIECSDIEYRWMPLAQQSR